MQSLTQWPDLNICVCAQVCAKLYVLGCITANMLIGSYSDNVRLWKTHTHTKKPPNNNKETKSPISTGALVNKYFFYTRMYRHQIIAAICMVQILGQLNSSRLGITSEEAKGCYVSQTALWNLTETTLVCVAFREIKADIMFFSLEPVTLRTWCLESNIYDSDITNSLFIFSLANLTCQISLLNFKGWYGQSSGAEVMKWYSDHLGLISVDYWLMVCQWAKWSVT